MAIAAPCAMLDEVAWAASPIKTTGPFNSLDHHAPAHLPDVAWSSSVEDQPADG